MTKTRPRYPRNLRRPNAAELTSPLPPILIQQLDAESTAVVEHRNAAERYVELSAAMPLAQVAVKRAQDEAAVATRAAVRAGKPTPQRMRDAVDEAMATLDRTGAELATVEDLLGETALALLVESLPRVRDAIAEAERRREGLLDEAQAKLAEVAELLEASGLVQGEAVWLAQLFETGEVAPFGARGGQSSAPRGYVETRHALARLVEGRELQRERVEQARHDELALNVVRSGPDSPLRPLPPSPSATVWTLPGEPIEVAG